MPKKTIWATLLGLCLLGACQKSEQEEPVVKGYLALQTTLSTSVDLKAAIDVSNFLVTVLSESSGEVAASGTAAALNAPIALEPGLYTVSVSSGTFNTPAFDAPHYGASVNGIAIVANQTANATLECRQTNTGVRIAYHPDMESYCNAKGYLYHARIIAAAGNLDYASSETRIGYFNPGQATLEVVMNGQTYSKAFALAATSLLTITVNVVPLPEDPTQLSLTITGDDAIVLLDDVFTFEEANPQVISVWSDQFTDIVSGNSTSSSGSSSGIDTRTGYEVPANVYRAGGAVRLGNGTSAGTLATLPLDLSANGGNVKVTLWAKGWISGDVTAASSVVISIGSESHLVAIPAGINLTDFHQVSASFTSGTSSSAVVLNSPASGERRLFVDELQVTQ